jgi:prophage regulatory protein
MLPFTRECPMPRRLVSKKELKSIYGVPYSTAHIARLEKMRPPGFPLRINLGQCRVAWFADEIEAWIEERAQRRVSTSPS